MTEINQDNHARLARFFREMVLIRETEKTLLGLFSRGLLRGTVHTSIGQEAIAVGLVGALDKNSDIICSNHRCHGHFLAYCGDVRGLIAEIMGLPDGVCAGIGGSQHIHHRNFYSNGVLGGMVGVAVGMAFAEKIHRSGSICVVFLGDGALAEGIVYEAMNIASLWQIPVLFAVEQNQYAQTTHWRKQHAGCLEKRAEPFGIKIAEVDGNNVVSVFDASTRAVSEIRTTHKPQLLFFQTYRMGPHSKGDDLRDSRELEVQQNFDPLLIARNQLGADLCHAIETEVACHIDAVVTKLTQASE